MAMTVLTIIFFAAGLLALLYSIVAGLSMYKYMQLQKSLPESMESTGEKSVTVGPPVAEALCNRARLLLKNKRFDAALADCKRAIDLNPSHAAAHTLWEHALEKELPSELVPEEVPAETKPVPEKKRILKKRKKIAKAIPKKVAAEKKPAVKPVPEEKPEEEIILLEPAVTPESVEAPAEVVEEPAIEEQVTPEEPPAVDEKAVVEEPAVVPEPDEVPPEAAEEPAVEEPIPPEEPPAVDEKAAVEEPAVVPEPDEVPPEAAKEPTVEEPIPPEEPLAVDEKAAVEEPAVAPEPAEVPPEAAEESSTPEEKIAAEEEHSLGEEIPLLKDRVPSEEPPGESPLEEIDNEKLRQFEKGEATSADAEWTRYADKEGPELAESKIRMHELPTEATGLKETILDLKQAEAYNLQGETNISKNLYTNAIKDFTRAININPKFVDALMNRGSAYAQLGRFNDALSDFNEALKYEKKDPELFNKRGEIFLSNNLFDQAIKDFTSSIVLNPMFSDAFLNRGRAYSEKGMPEEAMNDFNQAIKADSDHAAMPFLDRAAPAIQEDEAGLADRGKADSLNQQGVANMEKELYDEAIKNFTRAIDLQTTFADAYINRGRIYTLQKDMKKALADFNQAAMFDPLNAAIYYWRAQAWKAKDDNYNMTEDLKLACEMGYEAACPEYKKLKSPTK